MKIILELGCGKGRHAEYLRKKFQAEVHGIDIKAESIQEAQKNYPQVNFHRMSAEALAFPDSKFDAIYAFDVFEHVDDLTKTIAETDRVLKSGGQLIVNVPAPKSEQWLARIRPSYASDMHHVRIFREQEIEQLFLPRGFSLSKKRAEGFTDHAILYYLFKRSGVSGDRQLGIGNWRDTFLGKVLFGIHAFTKPNLVFESSLKYFPVWLITLPIGYLVNFIGNRFMPKSWYYEFIKK